MRIGDGYVIRSWNTKEKGAAGPMVRIGFGYGDVNAQQ